MDPMMQNIRCFGCGQMSHDRTDGPSPDEDHVGQCERWSVGVMDVHTPEGCRAAVLCWPCFWALEPDMWTSKHFYEIVLTPIVSFNMLPELNHDDEDCWNPTKYKWPLDEDNTKRKD